MALPSWTRQSIYESEGFDIQVRRVIASKEYTRYLDGVPLTSKTPTALRKPLNKSPKLRSFQPGLSFREEKPMSSIPGRYTPTDMIHAAINVQKIQSFHPELAPLHLSPVHDRATKFVRKSQRGPKMLPRKGHSISVESNHADNSPPLTLLPKLVPRNAQTDRVESVSVREAMRNREWLHRAKEQIVRDFSACLNRSNGVHVESTETFPTFRFFIGKGNNSTLIRQLLNSRWWWTETEDKDSANFVWTAYQDKEFIRQLPMEVATPRRTLAGPKPIQSQTPFFSIHSETFTSVSKEVDLKPLGFDLITCSSSFATCVERVYLSHTMKLHNRIEGNGHLTNKKGLFQNIQAYYTALGKNPFEVIPETYHVLSESHASFKEFSKHYSNGYWIVKPGENSNRGIGISVCKSLEQIQLQISNKKHTHVIQRYIEKPFLVNKRKFDIRCFALITAFNGIVQAYYYKEGYLRTASKLFSLSNTTNPYIHLTNDAIQQTAEDYGKFEAGNKLSYSDFQRYLDNSTSPKINFATEVLPRIKSIIKDTIQAVHTKIDPSHRAHTFEIIGYDFLLDSLLKPWLIEANTNPCLSLSSPQLSRIIPTMLENSFRLTVDPLFPEPFSTRRSNQVLPENKYELIFHSLVDGKLQN